MCTSECSSTWVPILFAYKGFVLLAGLLAGVLVAFRSCIVKTKPLNESCFVTVMVYVAVVVSIIVVTPIGLVLQHYPNVQYGIIGIVIHLSTSLILGLIFVPKVHKHYLLIHHHYSCCILSFCVCSGTNYIKIQLVTTLLLPIIT